jgi:anti-sigma B factor antagonist
MARFTVTTAEEEGRVRVALAGDCDLAVCAQADAALQEAVGRAQVVLVDVAALDFLDSSGLHCLVTAHHAARARGGRLYVVNAAGAVAAVLDLTGVAGLLSPAGVDAPDAATGGTAAAAADAAGTGGLRTDAAPADADGARG